MIYVMQIVNTHGIRGEVKALHYTDGEAFCKKGKTVYKTDSTPVTILSWRFQQGAVLLKLEGVDSVECAEKLKFTELFAKEEDLPLLPDGNVLGTVTEVIENNAANLLEITKTDGEKVLVPNIPVFVEKVDLADEKIYITPIEGLI